MASIFDLVHEDLTEERIDLIASKLGTNREQTRDAIAASLPAIIEAMGRKLEEPGGEEKFQNHFFNQSSSASSGGDGSMLDTLNDIIHREGGTPSNATRSVPGNASNTRGSLTNNSRPTGSPSQTAPENDDSGSASLGGDVLGELFGKRKDRVKDAVSKSSGIGMQQAGSLIAILGPLVIGMLARQQVKKKLEPGDLSGMVKDGRSKVQQSASGSMIAKMFDQDGDGDFDLMDVLSLAKSFLFRRS